MMRKLIMAGIAMMTIAISSCDEDTTTLGDSLTSDIDRFVTLTQSYRIETKSLRTDSVLASSMFQYLGKINDPETHSYITSDYMTQFNILENESSGIFPKEEYMSLDEDDHQVYADSCVIRIMISSFQGDSLSPMKLQLCELAKPVPNGSYYYSDFDPEEEGYLRYDFDENGNSIKDKDDNDISILNLKKSYTVSDLTMSDSLRNVLRGNNYYKYVTIPLTQPYTDKEGNTYPGYDEEKEYGSGYGTYLLRTYYKHPEYFKNSHTFARNVCPGFYLKTIDGTGVMLEVANTQIIVYYHYLNGELTTNSSRAFISTDEVLQTNHVVNDKKGIRELEQIDTCTFLKTPSGIFTEVELPIDSIIWLKQKDANGNELASHVNDTLMSAKITFTQMKSKNELSNELLEEPTDILMLPLDQLYSFFEKSSMPDNITSYLGTYNSVQKTYSFNALTGLINNIWGKMKPYVLNADGTVNLQKVEDYKKENPNWNKVVLVPVNLKLTNSSSTSSSVSSIFNSMMISSVRLVGGKNNKHAPINISVSYSKNE